MDEPTDSTHGTAIAIFFAPTLEDLRAEAARFANTLTPHPEHALLITLSGELGSGKTSFTQGMAAAFGVQEPITSPTFVLQKIYPLTSTHARGFSELIHMDAYRLESAPLAPLAFAEAYANPQNLIVLEWPEMVVSELPSADHALSFTVAGEGRTISYA